MNAEMGIVTIYYLIKSNYYIISYLIIIILNMTTS